MKHVLFPNEPKIKICFFTWQRPFEAPASFVNRRCEQVRLITFYIYIRFGSMLNSDVLVTYDRTFIIFTVYCIKKPMGSKVYHSGQL